MSPDVIKKTHPGIKNGDFLEDRGEFYRIEDQLTTTALGILYKAKNWRNHQPVIIKQFIYTYFTNPDTQENDCEKYWIREQKIIQLQTLSPIPTLHLLGALKMEEFETPEYYLILTFPVELKDKRWNQLDQWVKKNFSPKKPPSKRDLKIILESFLQPMCRHLEFIHKQGIVHRDISPKNVAIFEVDDIIYPIILDWGMAKEFPPEALMKPPRPFFQEQAPIATKLATIGAPPEVVDGYEPVAATDVYMCASILRYIITGGTKGRMPVLSGEYVLHLDSTGTDYPELLKTLIEMMTQYEPADRLIDFRQIFEKIQIIVKDLEASVDFKNFVITESRSSFIDAISQDGIQTSNSKSLQAFIPKSQDEELNAKTTISQSQMKKGEVEKPSSDPIKKEAQKKQFTPPIQSESNKPMEKPKENMGIKVNSSSKIDQTPKNVPKPVPAPKSAPTPKPLPVQKPASTTKPLPVQKPAPTPKPLPVQKPAPMLKPAPLPMKAPPEKVEIQQPDEPKPESRQNAVLNSQEENHVSVIKSEKQESTREREPGPVPKYLLERMNPKSRKLFFKGRLEFEKMNKKDLEDAMELLVSERIKFDEEYADEKEVLEELDYKCHHIQARLQVLLDAEIEMLFKQTIIKEFDKGNFKKYLERIGPNYSIQQCAMEIIKKLGKTATKIPLSEMALRNRIVALIKERSKN